MGGRGGAEQNKGDKGGYGGAMRDIAGGMGGNGGTEEDKGGNGGQWEGQKRIRGATGDTALQQVTTNRDG